MKQIKVAFNKRSEHDARTALDAESNTLKTVLERLKKKGLNPMQMCQKLIEHNESAPGNMQWTYDLVVSECRRLKVMD